MPIYEFACKSCQCHFETRVSRVGERPSACPTCGGTELEKELSTFAAHTGGSSTSASQAGPACGAGEACCAMNGGGCGGMNGLN